MKASGVLVLVVLGLILQLSHGLGERASARTLVSERVTLGEEEFAITRRGLKRRKGFGVGKAVKNVGSGLSNAAKEVSNAAKGSVSAVKNALSGKKLNRLAIWNDINAKDLGLDKAWKELLQGFDSMDNYFDNQFVDDLEWLGKQIKQGWDVYCDLPVAPGATIFACSVGLNAAWCAGTGGCGPWCGAPLKLQNKLIEMIGNAIARNLIACSVYHALKKEVCPGVAYSIGENVADLALSDPFTPVCRTAFSCSCGDCPYTCDFLVNPVCLGNEWKDGFKKFIDALESL